MGGRRLLAENDVSFDPDSVTIDDGDVLELLDPVVREWWVEQFGAFVPDNDGFFTPPQKQAIPLIHGGKNALIAAPTGSGKCIKPDTPLIIKENGEAEVIRAEDLLNRRGKRLAAVDDTGELYDCNIQSYSIDDGDLKCEDAHVYTEMYEGDLHKLETQYGRTVEVTPDHPLLVETGDGPEWRQAKDISAGDYIGVPSNIDLPESTVELDVREAIEDLESKFPTVLTTADSDRLVYKLETVDDIGELSEKERRELLALADLSFSDISSRFDISLSAVHHLITGHSTNPDVDLRSVLLSEFDPLNEKEIVVKTDNGRISRFTYPSTVDEEIALLAAFVLAEGFIGEYDRGGMIAISQKNRERLLEKALDIMREKFGVAFEQKDDIDYIVTDTVFSRFFSNILDIDPGKGRSVPFPEWVMNAPKPLKRSFISTFLSLEGEVRKDEVRVIQASEMKIEQLNYLLLSFDIFPARRTRSKSATNTDSQKSREYYELTVRGKDNLRTLLSEFGIEHPNTEALQEYTKGTTSGTYINKYQFDYESIRALSTYYENDKEFRQRVGNIYEVVRRSGRITEDALSKLDTEVETLPDGGAAGALREKIEQTRSRNVKWLEVTDRDTVPYEGEIIDLTVPNTHNFVGGRGGIYLHNTLASFTSIVNELFGRARTDDLDNSVYCLYISPLKSLANDIHRNLEVPLSGITEKLDERGEDVEIRHAIRHGDTDDAARQRMLETTPHILNTTPETLAILLNSPKFKRKLETVEYVIVDEIHSLAENKRGTHLSVSLERLEAMAEESPTRIGCSATVEPLSTMAEFLVGREASAQGGPRTGTAKELSREQSDGQAREYELVDARFTREFDVELSCPTPDLINTPRDAVNDRFYRQLHELIQDHTNTLVFTNTRSGAERVLHNLRTNFDAYDEDNSGCHHGSLAREQREAIEEQLKDGSLDVVTTSTSLELGIDMPHIDLVVQVGSPKSVAALLQRIGRAGHQLGETVTGRVIALDRDELVECAVMLRKAEEGFVDRVFVPENAQDVATQHVYGMAINGPRPESEVREILTRAYPYRNYTDDQWESLLAYLTADYPGLEDRNVYAKVWRDTNDAPDGEHHYEDFDVGRPLIGKRGRMARVIYMTNIGTIPDSFTCDVFTRTGEEWVGQLDEEYLDTLETGDVFVLGGEHFEFRYRRGSKVYVDRTSARPTVPSWFSERLPMSYDLGCEILSFQRRLLDRLAEGGQSAVRHWLREFPVDENSVRAIARAFDEQVRYAGPKSVATDGRLVIEEELDREEYQRRYYVHSTYGRRFNDGLSRLLAYHVAQAATANVQVAVADNGFTLSMPLNRKVDLEGIVADLDPDEVRADLRASLDGTDLLERYFRINAIRSLMILKRYKGYEKSASEQQFNADMLLGFAEDLDGFAVVEETYREILEDKLDVEAIEGVLESVAAGEVEVERHRVDSPTPRAFGLATLMASDVVLAEDESAVLQKFHERVLEEIGDDGDAVAAE